MKTLKKIFFIMFFILLICVSSKVQANEEKTYLCGVNSETTLYDLMDKFSAYDNIVYYDKDNKKIEKDYSTEIAKTGMKAELQKTGEDEKIIVKIYVKGDINGDGYRNEEDIFLTKQYMVGLINKEDIYKKAIDYNGDENISLYDLYYQKQIIRGKQKDDSVEDVNFKLSENNVTLEVGKSIKIVPKLEDREEDTNMTLTYESNDNKVATVDQDGNITAVGNGKTMIVAMNETGNIDSVEVTVVTLPTDIEFNKQQLELIINTDYANQAIGYSIKPENTNSMNEITWTTSDETIATVDETGYVKAKSNGKVEITATTENGVSKKINVIVKTVPSEIIVDRQNIMIEKGLTDRIEASVFPETANYNTELKYESSNPSIVEVDENGNLTAVYQGEATISVSMYNGEKVDVVVTVIKPIKEINFDKEGGTADLSNGNYFTITATDQENVVINNYLEWSSSNTEVATIDEQGKVIVLQNGEAVITAKKGDLSKQFNLKVVTSPTGINIENNRENLEIGEEKNLSQNISFIPETVNVNRKLSYTSSNPENVTVDETGKIKGIKAGSSIITIATQNGKKTNVLVRVQGDTSEIDIPNQILLETGKKQEKQIATYEGCISVEDIKINPVEDTIISIDSIRVNYDESEGRGEVIVSLTGIKEENTLINITIRDKSFSIIVNVYNELDDVVFKIGNDVIEKNTTYNMDISETATFVKINALLNNEEISEQIEWSSNNENVATVAKNGEIEIKGNGNVVITAKITDEYSRQINLMLYTSPTNIKVQNEITIYTNAGSATNVTNESIKATVQPESANVNTNISYKSSDLSIVEVNQNGDLTAKKDGDAVIALKTQNGKTATCTVHVRTVPEQIILSKQESYLKKGATLSLTNYVTVKPNNVSSKENKTYTSSNSNVARVNASGVITACGIGEAQITVKTQNGISSSIKIIVPSIAVTASNTTLKINGTKTAQIKVAGSNIGTITYKSSNTSVVSVNSSGLVTGLKNGTATITATESNAGTTSQINFTVQTLASGIKLNTNSASLNIKNTSVTLTATVSPSTVTTSGVTWSSSNENVVKVNSSGKITRQGEGTATVTASSKSNSSVKATCTVTVQREKVIIAGASTVCQMRRKEKCFGQWQCICWNWILYNI